MKKFRLKSARGRRGKRNTIEVPGSPLFAPVIAARPNPIPQISSYPFLLRHPIPLPSRPPTTIPPRLPAQCPPRSPERLNLLSMIWICTRRPPPSMAPPLLGHAVIPSPFWTYPVTPTLGLLLRHGPSSDHAITDATVGNPPQLKQFIGVMEEALSSCIANTRNIISARRS